MGCLINKGVQSFDDSVTKVQNKESEKVSVTEDENQNEITSGTLTERLTPSDEVVEEHLEQNTPVTEITYCNEMPEKPEDKTQNLFDEHAYFELKRAWDFMCDEPVVKDKDGKYIKKFENAIIKTQECEDDIEHIYCKDGEDTESRHVQGFYNHLADIGIVTHLCNFVADVLRDLRMSKQDDRYSEPRYIIVLNCLPKALRVLINFTDKGNNRCDIVMDHPSFLPCVFTQLRTWRKMITIEELTEYDQILLSRTVMLLFNMTLDPDTLLKLRDTSCMDVLIPFLKKAPDLKLKLAFLATVANLVEDKDSDVLQTGVEVIEYLIGLLEQSFQDAYHEYQCWTVCELTKVVRRLAKDPYNRRALVQQGVIFPLACVIESGKPHEVREAVITLWTLSNDDRNTKDMVEDRSCRVIETLQGLRTSDDVAVRNAIRILFLNIKDQLQQSWRYKHIAKDIISRKDSRSTQEDHQRHEPQLL